MEVCGVGEDQAHAEESTNWHDSAEVDPTGHWNLLSRVEKGGEASHQLGHGCGEDEMPCREEDWILEAFPVQDPFVEDDDGRAERYPHSVDELAILLTMVYCATYAM